jgi:hypothetical protein
MHSALHVPVKLTAAHMISEHGKMCYKTISQVEDVLRNDWPSGRHQSGPATCVVEWAAVKEG